MQKFLLILLICVLQIRAQDTIRFVDGRTEVVKVSEVGLNDIRYNRIDNITGPVYVVDKKEINFIQYKNGAVDSFNIKKPTVEIEEPTPAYVNTVPTEKSFDKILIIRKKLYYQHHGLSDRGLLEMITDYPEAKTKTLMLKEYSKMRSYKANRSLGYILLYGGIGVSVIGSSILYTAAGPIFLIGTAASITGSIMTIVNKNKQKAKRIDIANIYNGN